MLVCAFRMTDASIILLLLQRVQPEVYTLMALNRYREALIRPIGTCKGL